MVIHVKLFATLRHQYPHLDIGEAMPVDLPPGTTVNQLIDHLDLPSEQVKIVFVNNCVQNGEYVLNAADQVGIFPPVGGG
ncbi:MAG TPA: MoaD/ThiS family protein [Chloroflexi bacterium]|nr:MoaD/ThiS family protein [Chloroflexota bacterium]